jgi:cytochrome c oxidase assembly factor CtaG
MMAAAFVVPGALGRDDELGPLTAHTALTTWAFAPVVTACLIVIAVGYLALTWRVRREHPVRPWPWVRTLLFLSGLGVIAIATQSSIGAYDDMLFWIHMWQHLLLLMVAPPLLVLGQPVTLILHATHNPTHSFVKRVVRSRVVSVVTFPLVGVVLYIATVVGTHLTGFMNVVLTHPVAHDMEHVLYLCAGYLYFLPLIGREPIKWKLSFPTKLFLLVLAMPVDTFTGVVLSQTTHELFPAYAGRRTWGPSLVGDLHAGGAVMWIGGDAIMLVMVVALFIAVVNGRTELDAGKWLESARASRLDALAGASASADTNTDADDDRLAAYNAYLARLESEDHR